MVDDRFEDEEVEKRLNSSHKKKCKLCQTPYFPTIEHVIKLIFTCEVCSTGRDDSFRDLERYRVEQTRRREKLNKAIKSPSFHISFVEWLSEADKSLNPEEVHSLMFLKKTKMNNRIEAEIKNRHNEIAPWLKGIKNPNNS